jgi:DNA-binding MarR family transcriptional regulator
MATMTARFGFELPLLLAGAFRGLVDGVHVELAERGHPDARPLHGFALQAVGPQGATASELGRRLGVSKQAAAKTASGLLRLGYILRESDPSDARAVRLRRSPRGEEFLALSVSAFSRLRERLADEIGPERVQALENDLQRMVASSGGAKLGDLPGWLR